MKSTGIFIFLAAILVNTSVAQAGGANKCIDLFLAKELVQKKKSKNEIAKTAESKTASTRTPTLVKYTLEDFFTPDAEHNIAIKHPTIVMTAASKYAYYLSKMPVRKSKDPLYRTKPINIYPAFVGEMPFTGTKFMVGQYEPTHELVNFILRQASGVREGKVPVFLGPGGTGKTEMVIILKMIQDYLANHNVEFNDYTFEWVNLDKVPGTRPLIASYKGSDVATSVREDMDSSPFLLLRSDMQKEVLGKIRTQFKAKTNMELNAWTEANPKIKQILEEIFKQEVPEIAEHSITVEDLSKEEYLQILNKYVRIVKKKHDTSGPVNIVRAQPENPKYEMLFASENMTRMLVYGRDNPLLYDFTGKVFKLDGQAIVFDEIFRNDPALLDTLLELVQNSVVETDTGPAVRINALMVLTSNDESLARARENAALKAFVDRLIIVPTRSNIHPYEIAKTILTIFGIQNVEMSKLDRDNVSTPSPFVPVYDPLTRKNNVNELFPLPDEQGMLVGSDGRYAVAVNYMNEKILISPHVLESFGLATAATRLVTDPQKMAKYWSELQVVSAGSHYYTSVKSRLDVILGRVNVDEPIRDDLAKVKELMHEGESGISARETKRWFEKSLDLAIQSGRGVLTPSMVDQVFMEMLDQGEFQGATTQRAEWLNRYRLVQTEFIMAALYKDIRNITSGDGEKAERLYDTIEKELVAMSVNHNAKDTLSEDGTATQPIVQKRLDKIFEMYHKVNGREFQLGFLMRHLASTQGSGKRVRDPELLDAIQAYLTEAEIDITENVSRISDYYSGKNNDPKVERSVRDLENRLDQYGYDKISFIEAINYWDHLNRLNIRKNAQQ